MVATLAEMNVGGVSTRKVTAIPEERPFRPIRMVRICMNLMQNAVLDCVVALEVRKQTQREGNTTRRNRGSQQAARRTGFQGAEAAVQARRRRSAAAELALLGIGNCLFVISLVRRLR
ncbi:hypothetical protein [Caballeronia grimmiae]|uniref:hypothetical protein n=1 Tax=Caballeronia grimmiae TaxID=1071679 RepID=UPI0038B6D001